LCLFPKNDNANKKIKFISKNQDLGFEITCSKCKKKNIFIFEKDGNKKLRRKVEFCNLIIVENLYFVYLENFCFASPPF
jgi:hypothetical protein